MVICATPNKLPKAFFLREVQSPSCERRKPGCKNGTALPTVAWTCGVAKEATGVRPAPCPPPRRLGRYPRWSLAVWYRKIPVVLCCSSPSTCLARALPSLSPPRSTSGFCFSFILPLPSHSLLAPVPAPPALCTPPWSPVHLALYAPPAPPVLPVPSVVYPRVAQPSRFPVTTHAGSSRYRIITALPRYGAGESSPLFPVSTVCCSCQRISLFITLIVSRAVGR